MERLAAALLPPTLSATSGPRATLYSKCEARPSPRARRAFWCPCPAHSGQPPPIAGLGRYQQAPAESEAKYIRDILPAKGGFALVRREVARRSVHGCPGSLSGGR